MVKVHSNQLNEAVNFFHLGIHNLTRNDCEIDPDKLL